MIKEEENFIGRKWLFEQLLKFLSSDSNKQNKLLFIAGSPGAGKTSICHEIERISKSMSIEKSIINNRCLKIFYTKENANCETSSTSAEQIKDELNRLLIEKYADYYDLDRTESNLEVTLNQFGQKDFSEHNSFIMIDDIHVWSNEELLELITVFNLLPVWLKVIMTCDRRYFRSQRFLRRRFHSISIDGERSSRDDIEQFVQLKTNLPIEHLKPLIDKSENNFLFVSKSLELVNEGFIRPFEFKSIKPGLNGLYTLLLGQFWSLFTGDEDLKLAHSILSLFTLTPSRALNRDYVYKRVRLRNDNLARFDQLFYITKRMFLDSSSKLFHSTLREKLTCLEDEAYACETLFYWRKLCKFELQSARKTSTPLVPIATIEFIDQDLNTSTTSSTNENNQRHQRHLFYLNRFRRFYSCLDRLQNKQIDHKMKEILEQYKCESQASESSFIVDQESLNISLRTDKPTTNSNSSKSIISRFSFKHFYKFFLCYCK